MSIFYTYDNRLGSTLQDIQYTLMAVVICSCLIVTRLKLSTIPLTNLDIVRHNSYINCDSIAFRSDENLCSLPLISFFHIDSTRLENISF